MSDQESPPSWIIADMVTLSRVEPALFPNPNDPDQLWHHVLPASSAGGIYFRRLEPLLRKSHPYTLIVLPSLEESNTAGALTLPLRAALAAVAEGAGVALLTTGSSTVGASPLLELAPGMTVIPFGQETAALTSEDEKLTLLAQMVLNSSVRVLHVMHSREGWEVLRRWARQLRQVGMTLHATMLDEERDRFGLPGGFAATAVFQCAQHLDAIFTSTGSLARTLHDRDGVREECLFPLESPPSRA